MSEFLSEVDFTFFGAVLGVRERGFRLLTVVSVSLSGMSPNLVDWVGMPLGWLQSWAVETQTGRMQHESTKQVLPGAQSELPLSHEGRVEQLMAPSTQPPPPAAVLPQTPRPPQLSGLQVLKSKQVLPVHSCVDGPQTPSSSIS